MRVPPRIRTRRRRALLLAVAVAATTAPVATSSPAGAATCPSGVTSCVVVTVVKTDGGKPTPLFSTTVSPQQISEWSDFTEDRQYRKRRNLNGELSNGPLVREGQGLSLRGLLERVKTLEGYPQSAKDATFSETPNSTGIPAVLSGSDLVSPADPVDGKFPFISGRVPAVYQSGSAIGYVRPLRDAKTDVNASDIFTVKGPLNLVFHTTGQILSPTVTSSAGTALNTKSKSTFSATFTTNPDIVRSRWDFGDGTVAGTTLEKLKHSYAKKGTYPVVVSVYGEDGSYGRSAALAIKVDKPPKAPSSGTGGTGGGTGGLGGGSGYIPPLTPGLGNLPPVSPPTDDLPPDTTPTTPQDDGLEQVEGYVLAGSELAPGGVAEQIPGTADTDAAPPVGQESTRRRLATWTLVALAAAFLLGAGAASETRWFRTQLRHLRRRA